MMAIIVGLSGFLFTVVTASIAVLRHAVHKKIKDWEYYE
jgi:hypothetical protein